ncbi:hypothetical protein HYV49_03635 [Candidatus Pacearchaeota archaeon]|nr:hypothetical protein [Candidatus Pacearchaeota archaeon]
MIPKDYSYIKLKPEQAVILRKNILTLEMDLLQFIQRITNYKALKKSENQYRVMMRKALDESSQEIRAFFSSMPQFHEPTQKAPRVIHTRQQREKITHHREPIKKIRKPKMQIRKIGHKEAKREKLEPTRLEHFKNRIRAIKEREQIASNQKEKARSGIQDKLGEIKRRLSQLGVNV